MPRPAEIGTRRDGSEDCALCGTPGLTKTHVPPKCAGNGGSVRRWYLTQRDGNLEKGKPSKGGGLYFFGLCNACNGVQGRYELAYRRFRKVLLPYWIKDWVFVPVSGRQRVVVEAIRPGAVARSVLISVFALNPSLRGEHPQLAASLAAGSPAVLPAQVRLRMALCVGTTARVGGNAVGQHLTLRSPDGRTYGVDSLAHIYFPPLAWNLEDVRLHEPNWDTESYLDLAGWSDVSSWLGYDPEQGFTPENIISLAALSHPWLTPALSNLWSEMFEGSRSEMLEADRL